MQSVLDAALQGKGITYKIEDNIVYLSAPGEPQTPQQTGQEHTVTGTVVDATGEALIGVNVQVKGNPTAGTITDFEGNYSLSVPGNGEVVETEQQKVMLQGFGCNKAQGYFYARPMREAEYTELLRKEKAEN